VMDLMMQSARFALSVSTRKVHLSMSVGELFSAAIALRIPPAFRADGVMYEMSHRNPQSIELAIKPGSRGATDVERGKLYSSAIYLVSDILGDKQTEAVFTFTSSFGELFGGISDESKQYWQNAFKAPKSIVIEHDPVYLRRQCKLRQADVFFKTVEAQIAASTADRTSSSPELTESADTLKPRLRYAQARLSYEKARFEMTERLDRIVQERSNIEKERADIKAKEVEALTLREQLEKEIQAEEDAASNLKDSLKDVKKNKVRFWKSSIVDKLEYPIHMIQRQKKINKIKKRIVRAEHDVEEAQKQTRQSSAEKDTQLQQMQSKLEAQESSLRESLRDLSRSRDNLAFNDPEASSSSSSSSSVSQSIRAKRSPKLSPKVKRSSESDSVRDQSRSTTDSSGTEYFSIESSSSNPQF